MLQCCLNGARDRASHPRLPVSPDDIVDAAIEVAAMGVQDLHIHPKGPDGSDTLDPAIVDSVAKAIRSRLPDVTFGFTTGAWTASPADRLSSVRGWGVLPDHASVNWHEDGADTVAAALLERGIGVEAGLWSGTDGVERFLRSPLRHRVLRVLIEATEIDTADAVRSGRTILRRVDAVPRHQVLLHGEDDTAWALVREAVTHDVMTRIGLEDTLRLPDGTTAGGNAELVAAAIDLLDGHR